MGDGFRIRAKIYPWISVKTVAPLQPKCAFPQTMRSQRNLNDELQYKAKQDLISISKKFSNEILVIWMFLCDKGIAMPQRKFGYFLALTQSVWPFSVLSLALFGFLLKLSSGNLVYHLAVDLVVHHHRTLLCYSSKKLWK